MDKKDVSLIIPTYNEVKNLPLLVEEIFNSIDKEKIDLEIIVIDDNSPDGTGVVAEELAKKYPIQVVHRSGKLGLGSAVIAGFKKSNRRYVGVMDADLSHDPAILNNLIFSLDVYDITIGSRFETESSVEQWVWWRKLLSKIGVALARRLVHVQDPLSGYFFLRKEVVDQVILKTVGYKILFEILVKGVYQKIKEIPFRFRVRKYSASKLTAQEYLYFLKQLFVYSSYKVCIYVRNHMVICSVFVVFLTIALYATGTQSIWLDEGITLEIIHSPLRSIFYTSIFIDSHPPLYYLLLHVLDKMVPISILGARLVSQLFYLLTGVVFFKFIKSSFKEDSRIHLAWLIFLLSSPFALFYASEIRSYMLVIFVGLVQFIAFNRFCETTETKESRKTALWFVVVSIISVYLFYPFIFTLIGEGIYVVLFQREKLKHFFVSGLAILATYIPWMYLVIFKRIGDAPGHFLKVPWWQIPAVIWVGFSGGRVSITDVNHLHWYWPTISVALVYVLNFVGLYWWFKNKISRPKFVGRIWCIAVSVVVICLAISYFRFSIFDPRYYTQIFPLFILLLIVSNWYIYKFCKPYWRIATGLLCAAHCLCLFLYLFNPWYVREPWKQVVPQLESELQAKDAVVFIGSHQPPPTYTPYQKKNIEVISTYFDGLTNLSDYPAIEQYVTTALQDNDRVWYSQFLEWQKDPEHRIRQMIEKDFIYKKTIGFFKVQFDLYERKK